MSMKVLCKKNKINSKKRGKIDWRCHQSIYWSTSINLRINVMKEWNYSTYYIEIIYVIYYREVENDKILEAYIITIYNTVQGEYNYIRTIGT